MLFFFFTQCVNTDVVHTNEAFRALLFQGQRSFQVHDMENVLPSMSVPNWVTLLTGAAPEITGLRGNLFPGETSFDNVFARQSAVKTYVCERITKCFILLYSWIAPRNCFAVA
jgi:predicted AlkP superfamily pyrophosphatase or phosphodiesterase